MTINNTNPKVSEFLDGKVLLLNKPLKWSSFDVVKKVKYLLKFKFKLKKIKVGHSGTLDPLATGLMIICTGKATKTINDFLGKDKEYIAGIKLGATTPSFDLETEINNTFPFEHITKEHLQDVLEKQFLGEIEQRPPLFSAKRINGVRAYEHARKGDDIVLKKELITINEIKILDFDLPNISLQINCSKGTYIRSIANDLGIALNSGGHLTSLIRTKIGDFHLDNAMEIEDFQNNIDKM